MSDFELLTQKYKKKVEVVDERSTPEARAARVKRLRNLANLSRKEMCDGDDLNVNTLKGWEIARYGGLPLDGAHKIVKRVAREGVLCTVEWLLYEDGPVPNVNVSRAIEQHTSDNPKQPEEINIEEELMLFHKHYSSAIHCVIQDDSMSPFYEKGDVVSGSQKIGQHIEDILETNCIVQLASGQLLCRRLRKGKLKNTYNLLCMNVESSVESPIIVDAEIISAARIVWHRKSDHTLPHKKGVPTETFIRQISHDIHSPIAALRMLLDDTKDLSEAHEEFLNNILFSLNTISDNLIKKR